MVVPIVVEKAVVEAELALRAQMESAAQAARQGDKTVEAEAGEQMAEALRLVLTQVALPEVTEEKTQPDLAPVAEEQAVQLAPTEHLAAGAVAVVVA